LKSEDILKHRDTENTEKERGKRGEEEGIYCKGWEVG
jgi:hypothetical protein